MNYLPLALAIVATITGGIAIFAAWTKVTKTKRDDAAASWLFRQTQKVYQYVGKFRTAWSKWRKKPVPVQADSKDADPRDS